MAVFDRETQKIVLRIVYDGPARAGKTTNVEQLCGFFTLRRRSELFVPEQLAGRTLFFDWMQLDGGLVAGHQLRCQIVSVPGQRRLAPRRKQILQTADVVVFVCSSARRSLDTSRSMLESLRWSLRSVGRADVPLIVQANKQDLKSAATPDEIREALGLEQPSEVLSACARDGVGVRETAVTAIRAGAQQVGKDLMERGIDDMSGRAQSADELLGHLREVDGGALDFKGTMDELFDEEEGDLDEDEHGAQSPGGQSASDHHTAAEQVSQAVTTAAAAAAHAARAGRQDGEGPADTANSSGEGGDEARPPKPSESVSHGCVWPSATGRQILKQLGSETWTRRHDLAGKRGVDDGSGSSDAMIFRAGGWCVKTSPRRRFANMDDGRAALLRLARKKILLGDMLPPRSVLSLQEDHSGTAWMWSVAPWMRTLRAEMTIAAGLKADETLAEALAKYARAATWAAKLTATSGIVLDVHPSNFACVERQVFYLDDDIDSAGELPGLGHAILQRIEEFAEQEAVVSRYVHALRQQLTTVLGPDDLRSLNLIESFEQAITRHPHATQARSDLVEALDRHARGRA